MSGPSVQDNITFSYDQAVNIYSTKHMHGNNSSTFNDGLALWTLEDSEGPVLHVHLD